MTGIMQVMLGGNFAPALPTTIGQAYGGGFYAGKINVSGTQYYLIVSPKSTGETFTSWGTYNVTTGITSVIAGPSNTTSLVALGANYLAAIFCNNLNSGSGLNGYTDWYLPAKNELEVCYYNLKPTTSANDTASGANANAVSPEPVSTNYTTGSPAQTSAGIGFRTGETNAFSAGVNEYYATSTEYNNLYEVLQGFDIGDQSAGRKDHNQFVRAVRRIPI